jgi:hypothetical protein
MPIVLLLLALSFAWAETPTGKPPIVSEVDRARADRVRALDGTAVTGRFAQLLAARELDERALFSLAETNPGIVEQVLLRRYQVAMTYLDMIPAPVLFRLRNGETVIRTELKGRERESAVALAEAQGIAKPKKIEAVRIGPFEGRAYRFEVVGKKGTASLELAWPSTPERDEKSRDDLARLFGARPTRPWMGTGARLAFYNGSFEDSDELTPHWILEEGVVLGNRNPVAAVSIDTEMAIDGTRSLRFYGDVKTRMFPVAVQRVRVEAGTRLRATAQLRADNLRPEYQQRPGDVFLALSFEDAAGQAVGSPVWTRGNMSSHPWQALVVNAEAPPGAVTVRVAIGSALSGTAWFDGVTLEQAP